MRDPELVSRAQHAAARLESAWERWRTRHGLGGAFAQPVASYVGYSPEEPRGRPRVVFGVDAVEAEQLAVLLDTEKGWVVPGHPGFDQTARDGAAGAAATQDAAVGDVVPAAVVRDVAPDADMPAVVGAGPVGLDSAIVGAVAPGVPMSGVPMPGAAPGVQAAQAPGAVGCATGPAAADEQIPAGHSSAPGGSDWAPRSATTAVRPAPCPSAPQVEEAGGRPGDAVSAAAVSAGAPVPGPVGAASGDRPGDVARAVAVLDGPAVPGPVGAASDGRPDDTVELAGGPVAGALPVPCPPEPAGAVAGGGLGDAVSPAAVVPAGGPVAGALATSRPPVSAGQVAGGGPGDAASAPVAGDGLPVPDDGRASAGPDTAALPAVSITAELVGWMASELPGQAAAGLDAWVHGPAGPEPTQTRRDVPAPRADAESARDDKIGPLPWLS